MTEEKKEISTGATDRMRQLVSALVGYGVLFGVSFASLFLLAVLVAAWGLALRCWP